MVLLIIVKLIRMENQEKTNTMSPDYLSDQMNQGTRDKLCFFDSDCAGFTNLDTAFTAKAFFCIHRN